MRIPFLKPGITRKDIDRAVESIKTGWLVNGDYTKQLEKGLEDYLGVPNVTVVSSCTAALHMALILAGVKEGDEVITTPMSWVATANVILYQKARPIFVDVDETGLIDISKIEEKITPRTKAIIPVHLYGQMVDMPRLKELADFYNLTIIEDAAHALEAKREVKPGQLGLACFSFHAAKNITSGQGGAIASSDKFMCELLRRDGVTNIDGKRIMLELGHKYDMTDFQAALLIGQLERIEKTHELRKRVYERYAKEFGKTWQGTHACHMFTVEVENRDLIRKRLQEKGIETSIHYTPIHLEPYYQKLGYKKGFPVAERMGERIITLPTYPMTNREQDYVIDNLRKEIRCKSH
jgi:dTDP-4-amino-4,6-dideoxygalactose transaminase